MSVRLFQLLWILSVALVSSSCGSDPLVAGKVEGPVGSGPDPDVPMEVFRRASEAQLNCPDPTSCHPSAALMTAVSGREVQTCSAFLVGPDLVATNSHCIPDELKPRPDLCDGRVWITFAGSRGLPPERRACARIEYSSPIAIGNPGPDYAWIRLKKSIIRPAFKIDRRGFQEQGSVKIFRADVEGPGPAIIAALRMQICPVVPRSMLLPTFNDPRRAVVSVGHCLLPGGSHGAALAGSDDRFALGIAQSLAEAPSLFRDRLRSYGLLNFVIEPLVVGTNFACVSEFQGMQAVGALASPETCHPETMLEPFDVELGPRYVRDISQQLRRSFDGWLIRAPDWQNALSWSIVHRPTRVDAIRSLVPEMNPAMELVVALPECVENAAALLSRTRDGVIPYWTFRTQLTTKLQKYWNASSPLVGPGFLNARIGLTARSDRFVLRMVLQGQTNRLEAPYEVELPSCPHP